ncbi:MAG: Type 1 glutamine amidotransferase-like domain-containing protein [Desulfosarcina sp.]|jgi:cyanophycinase
MSGHLLLEGGAEFGGAMASPDREAIRLAGGLGAAVAVIPAAAAPDHNDERAGRRAVNWFRGLGALKVESLPLVNRASADDPDIADRLRQARLIYLLGGFPAHLAESLMDSLSWRALQQAYHAGAVIAGSSAGAMVLCSDYFDPTRRAVNPGLDLLADTCVIPHHDTFGRQWVLALKRKLPGRLLMGIDEETGTISQRSLNRWQVHGKGRVTCYRSERVVVFGPGQSFHLGELDP